MIFSASKVAPEASVGYDRPLYTQEGSELRVDFFGGRLIFDIVRGLLKSWHNGVRELLERGPVLNLWRAPTDNDGTTRNPGISGEWQQKKLAHLQFRPISFNVDSPNEESTVIRIRGICAPAGYVYGFRCDYTYTITASGTVRIDLHGVPYGPQMPSILPRIGLQFLLPQRYGDVSWYGRGPEECYSDSKEAGRLDLHRRPIEELMTNYTRPQENGTRIDTRWVCLRDDLGSGLLATAPTPMIFSAHRYSLENLSAARHTSDLVDAGRITLNLDYAMRGLGSASCGPAPEEPYELHPHEFVFSVVLRTFTGTPDEAMRVFRTLPAQIMSKPQKSEATVPFIATTRKQKNTGMRNQQDPFACD